MVGGTCWDRVTVADSSGRLRHPTSDPESGCGGDFLFESMNASVEMIPAMVMEDVHVGRGDAPEAF